MVLPIGVGVATGEEHASRQPSHVAALRAFADGNIPLARRLTQENLNLADEVGDDKSVQFMMLKSLSSSLSSLEGDYDSAGQSIRTAIYVYDKHLADNPNVRGILGILHVSLASVLKSDGKFEESIAEFERSIEILENDFDDKSPTLLNALSGLAGTLMIKNEFSQARIVLDRALSISKLQIS